MTGPFIRLTGQHGGEVLVNFGAVLCVSPAHPDGSAILQSGFDGELFVKETPAEIYAIIEKWQNPRISFLRPAVE